MDDVDARVVTLMFAQLALYVGRISDQIKLADLFNPNVISSNWVVRLAARKSLQLSHCRD